MFTPSRSASPVTTADSIIRADSLTKEFKPEAGVFELGLDVERGGVLGLIGPSGSGKTTTVRLMAGLLKPDSGGLRVFGKNPMNFDKNDRARIGYMPQHAVLYPSLTLLQNLQFASSLFGMTSGASQLDDLVEFVELDGAMDRLPAQASGGEKRRVSLASTLVHDPDLIFLDEPTAGIDPVLRRKFWDHFRSLSENGKTLVVTTQYVGEAVYCDMVAVLDKGRMVALDTPDGLRRTAYGGEILDLKFERPPDSDRVDKHLSEMEVVRSTEWLGADEIRLVVDDAGDASPQIARWADENGVSLTKLEPFSPPFDDVFVDLLESLLPSDDSEQPAESS